MNNKAFAIYVQLCDSFRHDRQYAEVLASIQNKGALWVVRTCQASLECPSCLQASDWTEIKCKLYGAHRLTTQLHTREQSLGQGQELNGKIGCSDGPYAQTESGMTEADTGGRA